MKSDSMKQNKLYRRVIRRETHSPRSVGAMLIAAIVVLALAWIGVETVLYVLGRPALLVSSADAVHSGVRLDKTPQNWLLLFGIVAAVVGILVLLAAFAPGRRARHHRMSSRSAVVIDNRVIASAFAARAAAAAGVGPDQVRASVGHKRSEVRITPTTGMPVDTTRVNGELSDAIDRDELQPKLRSRVVVSAQGVVGG